MREQEQAMAEQLVGSMTSETFDVIEYRDTYREALEKLIDAKLTGTQLAPPPEAPVEAPIDLEQALRASLNEAPPRGLTHWMKSNQVKYSEDNASTRRATSIASPGELLQKTE